MRKRRARRPCRSRRLLMHVLSVGRCALGRKHRRSREAVISVSVVSGLAPGSWVTTWMVGKSTTGSAETGRAR